MSQSEIMQSPGLLPTTNPQAYFSQVLLVEDDLAQLRTLTRIMEAEGFKVVGCQLAREALQLLQQTFFGVVIIDLNLPDLHGVELAEQIRQHTDAARIIVHTGYGSFAAAKALLNLGVFALVEKLSDPQELVSHVHRAIQDQISLYAKKLEQTVAERTDQLRETAIWLELAETAAGVGAWDWDLTTQTARCSPTCLALYGQTPTDQPVLLEQWLRSLHPEDAPRILREVDEAIAMQALYHSDYRVVWPNGTIRWTSNRGQVLYSPQGKPLRFIGATIDVTERVEAQAALQQAYSELETRVQERTAELQYANQRLLEEVEERRKTEQVLRLTNTKRKAAEIQRYQQTLALMSLWKADVFKQGYFTETIREIIRVAAETLQVARVAVWLFSEDRSKIQCLTLYQLATQHYTTGDEMLAIRYPAYFQALEKSRIIVAHHAQTDPETCEFAADYLKPLGITAMMDAPIRIDEGLVGILCHEHVGGEREWTVEEQSFANSLADLLAIAIQTNKRFQVEQKLHESEELRHLAVEGAGIGLWDWDLQHDTLQVDERWAAIRGYQLPEITPARDFWLKLIHPDDLPEVNAKLQQYLDGEIDFYQTEYRTQTKDGQWKWILSRGKVVQWDDAGHPVRFLGTQLDITDYKHLEQQLRHAQKMEAIGRLAGGIAHDFNNVLTVIISYSELVLKRNDLEARTRLRVEEIKKAGERAALLTQQLLTFSRKQVMTTVVLDLNLVVTEMDQMLRRLIGEDIDLRLYLAPAPCWVKADPVQVEQVIMNLVINARDAMPVGGKMTIETSNMRRMTNPPQLHQRTAAHEYIRLVVADSGIGMDAETQARIFEPFFTTKEAGKGTGLGLSMVFGIVQQHNGWIEVDSEVGRGTAFSIYVPCAQQSTQNNRVPSALPDVDLAGEETILLVEDEEQIRVLANIALQEAGYTTLVAANGQEALTLARQYTGVIHLLLTDVIMPGMNGVKLSEEIDTLYPAIKTLYISGYADSKLTFPLLESTGRTAYLPKPFTPGLLTQKVREVLDLTAPAPNGGHKSA
ncbi:MAG: response regulator [Caldilinea sp. CFX5]|nr:response regulator [Caldilinea sp. CFX5]